MSLRALTHGNGGQEKTGEGTGIGLVSKLARESVVWAALIFPAVGGLLNRPAAADDTSSGGKDSVAAAALDGAPRRALGGQADQRRLALLEEIATSSELSLSSKISKIAKLGLGASVKGSDPARGMARDLLVSLAHQSNEGAEEILKLADAVRSPSERNEQSLDLYLVALGVGPKGKFGSPERIAIEKRISGICSDLSDRAQKNPQVYSFLQAIVRRAGSVSSVGGAGTDHVYQLLKNVQSMGVIAKGPANDHRSIRLCDALFDGGVQHMGDPRVFGLLLRVFEKVDQYPILLGTNGDKDAMVLHGLLCKFVRELHQRTRQLQGVRAKGWIDWYDALTPAERRDVLIARRSERMQQGADGGRVILVNPNSDGGNGYTAGGEKYEAGAQYPDRQMPQHVIFVLESQSSSGSVSPWNPLTRNRHSCVEKIRNLPDGTRFTVLFNSVDPNLTWGSVASCWPEMTVANAKSRAQACEWVLKVEENCKALAVDAYHGIAKAVELLESAEEGPKRIVYYTNSLGMNVRSLAEEIAVSSRDPRNVVAKAYAVTHGNLAWAAFSPFATDPRNPIAMDALIHEKLDGGSMPFLLEWAQRGGSVSYLERPDR